MKTNQLHYEHRYPTAAKIIAASCQKNNITQVLNRIPKTIFIVYGFNKSESRNNVIMKKFSEDGFIEDLASARGIITNGGFSLISEAVYLRKPVCSVPIVGQFEQYVNAAYIEKSGYGRHFNDFSSDAIKSFLFDLDVFQVNINQYKQNGNLGTFRKLDEIIGIIVK